MAVIEIPEDGLRANVYYTHQTGEWGYVGEVYWHEILVATTFLGDIEPFDAEVRLDEWVADKLRKVFA
jgi:hypothetical protein